jgi:hypothetical protein
MATALTALKKQIQIGNEGTPGTAVAATEVLLGIMEANLTSQVFHYPEDDRNLLSIQKGNEFQVSENAELNITGSLNHRHAPFLFGSSIRGNITPTQPDATNEPNAYLWTYQHSLTSGNDPSIANGIDTYTIEFGDNLDDYEAEYCFIKTLVLSGEAEGPVEYDVTFQTALITKGITPTAALTVNTGLQYFPANRTSFYIDTSYANIGNTAKTDLLKSWTWTLETMFTARFTASGSLKYAGVNEAAKSVKLELEYKRGTLSEVEKALYEANSPTYLRLKLEGGTELDSSQSNPPYIYLDGAYHYTEWPAPEDADGARSETVMAESFYDATGTRDFEVAVFTDLDTWPV